MRYCVTIHIEVEADDIDEASDFGNEVCSRMHYGDDWAIAVESAVVGDVEEIGE